MSAAMSDIDHDLACLGAAARDAGGGMVECIECGKIVRAGSAVDRTFGFDAICDPQEGPRAQLDVPPDDDW